MSKFANLSIDIPVSDVDRLFCYKLSEELGSKVQVGMRAYVPFGSRTIIGYIIELADSPDDSFGGEIKEILSLPDDFPVLTAETIELAKWMKERYYTTLSQCIKTIIPSSKKDGNFSVGKNKEVSLKEPTDSTLLLTDEQNATLSFILESIESKNKNPILLHGVTGSGKTEIYTRVIKSVLDKGKSAIMLLPEIGLTPQFESLFQERFGSNVAVTHSRKTSGERFVIWKKALEGKIKLIIGPRSAVFTPFSNLGLIIIDEEHEHTYRSETTPKYDTREVAKKRANLCNAHLVLGSATPALESYYKTTPENQSQNIYQRTELPNRVNKLVPQIEVIDMKREVIRGNMSPFSGRLIEALKETIQNERQAIIFLNRRGFASYVSCRWCGFVATCDECRVNHTYHIHSNRLICHYCGKSIPMPKTCPSCNTNHIRRSGMGTQKIEDEIKQILPDVGVLRMDFDTTKGKQGHSTILNAFAKGKAQILIGTQMVAKGLDFPKCTLVGVIDADKSLYNGDFRSWEHTFQLLTQVAGRAGRAIDIGRVFIQTYSPEHYAIRLAVEGNYKKFYEHEMTLRRAMCYPPLSHVFSVMFIGDSEKEVIQTLYKLEAIMKYVITKSLDAGKPQQFDIIGVSPAGVSKAKNKYRWKILIKSTNEDSLVKFVQYSIRKLQENDSLKGIMMNLSLNPIILE